MTTSQQVTVTTTPTLLSRGRTPVLQPIGGWRAGHRIGVTCESGEVFMGKDASNLSSTNYAVKLPTGAGYERFLEPGERWYAVTASGSVVVHVDAEGVNA